MLSLLLTGIFTTLTNLPKADRIIRKKKTEILTDNFIQMRLQQLMNKCLLPDNREFFFEFCPKNKTLSFVLNLGIDREPEFSGPVKAVVSLDKESKFKVDYFSIEDPKKKRSEILAENIKNVDFYFFETTEKKWLKNIKQSILPIMLKITLKKTAEEISFAYIFAQDEPLKVKS